MRVAQHFVLNLHHLRRIAVCALLSADWMTQALPYTPRDLKYRYHTSR